jgi:hypothetical protein
MELICWTIGVSTSIKNINLLQSEWEGAKHIEKGKMVKLTYYYLVKKHSNHTSNLGIFNLAKEMYKSFGYAKWKWDIGQKGFCTSIKNVNLLQSPKNMLTHPTKKTKQVGSLKCTVTKRQ